MEDMLLRFQNLMKKSIFGKIQFDYLSFYNLLKEYRNHEMFKMYLNKINLENSYNVEVNEDLKDIFIDLIENLIRRDLKVLNGTGLSQILNIMEDRIERRDFNGLLESLSVKINPSNFQKLSIWLKGTFKIPIYSMSALALLITISGTDISGKLYAQEINNSNKNQEQVTNKPSPSSNDYRSIALETGIKYKMPDWYFKLVKSSPHFGFNMNFAFKVGIEKGKPIEYFEKLFTLNDIKLYTYAIGIQNDMQAWYFEGMNNLGLSHEVAYGVGAEYRMPKWYFELILSNPNLSDNQLKVIQLGAQYGKKRDFFDWIISSPNLEYFNTEIIRIGFENKMPDWYFKLTVSNLTNLHIEAAKLGAESNMPKWYFELIYSNANLDHNHLKEIKQGIISKKSEDYFNSVINGIQSVKSKE